MPDYAYFKAVKCLFVHLDPKGRLAKGCRSSNRAYNLNSDFSVNQNISERYLGVKRLHIGWSLCQLPPKFKFAYPIYPPLKAL